MKSKILKMKIIVFSVFFFALSWFENPLFSMATWGEFSEVRDKRNFKEAKGGKGIPAQGRILENSRKTLQISQPLVNSKQACPPWNYVVAMNCRRGDRSIIDIVNHLVTELLPIEQRHRLGIIIGINEKISVGHPGDYNPEWEDILGGKEVQETLCKCNVPILLVYYQWTSFWEHTDTANKTLPASIVRQLMLTKLSQVGSEGQKEEANKKIEPVDKSHQFPYGRARSYILEIPEAKKFITQFDSPMSDVYIHIQDSDFISFNETSKFGFFQTYGAGSLIPVGESYLLSKYDRIIDLHKKRNGRLPIIVGGAHVYNPQENISDYLKQHENGSLDMVPCKEWTRFGCEMGNSLKHIIGIQQPYGLYFHEPNTLILSPISALRLSKIEESRDWKTIYNKLAKGFQFGIDSELQDYTRMLFKEASNSVCCMGMSFLATAVLSTSMKRGKKPFTIECNGKYDEKSAKFSGCMQDSLKKLRGMSQEIMHPNKWMSVVATSFAAHRKYDARKVLCRLFGIFDPLNPLYAEHFRVFLMNYEDCLLSNRPAICDLFRSLSGFYNKKQEGNVIAKTLIDFGWECGQVMRLMLLNTLCPPEGMIIHPEQVGKDAREFLARRFNFLSTEPNPHSAALLLHVPSVKELPPLSVIIPKQEHRALDLAIDNAAAANCLQSNAGDVTFTAEKYVWLLGKIKEKIEAKELTYKEVTNWAGYSGNNGKRDFEAMKRKTLKAKEWNNLIKKLKEKKIFEEYFGSNK